MVASQSRQIESQGQELEPHGYSINDSIYPLLDGFHNVSSASQHLMVEMREVAEKLFPYQSKSESKFCLNFATDERLEDFLDAHLFGEGTWHIRDKSIRLNSPYSQIGLDHFLDEVAYRLLINGEDYYSVDWRSIEIGQHNITIPIKFRYLPASTIRTSMDEKGNLCYLQKYNPLLAPNDSLTELKGKSFKLRKENIFAIKYPFGESPVRLVLKLIKQHQDIYQQINDRIGLSSNHSDSRLHIERLRNVEQNELLNQQRLVRAKIRKIFRLPVDHWLVPQGNLDLNVTDFYRAYRLVDYLKYLREFRRHLINEFNNQVVYQIAERNSFHELPKIQYVGKQPSLLDIERAYESFTNQQISFEELVEKLTN